MNSTSFISHIFTFSLLAALSTQSFGCDDEGSDSADTATDGDASQSDTDVFQNDAADSIGDTTEDGNGMELSFDADSTDQDSDDTLDADSIGQDSDDTFETDASIAPPVIIRTIPLDDATGAPLNRAITVAFSEIMDGTSIDTDSFSLRQDLVPVVGSVTVSGSRASLQPASPLLASTRYTATITTDAQSITGVALETTYVWSFTTGDGLAAGPDPVDLGTASNYVILAKSGIDTVPSSILTGDIGVSPIDSTAITGFSLTMDSSGEFSTASQVVGRVYAADYTVPTPSNLTTAISDMELAFTDAAGRAIPDFTELGAGDISGLTLVPGLYKWGTSVLISTDVTLSGGPDDVWIFQIGGGITQASGVRIILAGGARPQNIFWQAFGGVALDTNAHFEGIVISQTEIALATGATMNGRLLSQTAVTLDSNTVTQPTE